MPDYKLWTTDQLFEELDHLMDSIAAGNAADPRILTATMAQMSIMLGEIQIRANQ
jgi:hypothetical protein